ncbi:MAG: hypothetical protein BSOLF_2295 [Candidatus Carbobacillus altaicus]|uniref:Uncharacterized protein n=1 Tax=Candidatus Carbonibacillus altaicus TaxID=2163959 RepID=A0A2R6Y2Z4_9BACL|nr:MAG: hypothetical protein BSOLF_2295 [Candidatus Carbobacillus altaicus]
MPQTLSRHVPPHGRYGSLYRLKQSEARRSRTTGKTSVLIIPPEQ